MRTCAKPRCNEPAAATVAMRYLEREVELVDLLPDHDPNLLDFCAEHADRLIPPIGWRMRDGRTLRRNWPPETPPAPWRPERSLEDEPVGAPAGPSSEGPFRHP